MIPKLLNFPVLVWKDDTALYFPDGVSRLISCNHVNEGTFGVNIRGEVFPLPSATVVQVASPPTSPPTDFNSGAAFVSAGNVYGTSTPFVAGTADYKACIRIKDLTNLVTSYVDATSYNANIYKCNFRNVD